ncbi:alpha/beta hydrolase [Agromyces intestinalis]|uniref:Alpha/beta hydrolase n=1 Tax=Agromyces intestinalis TaxID=2592652 RepID=A0A5C1YLV0_9MICO|nr:alpha/beta hydrolase [Agromyces intestinalis]
MAYHVLGEPSAGEPGAGEPALLVPGGPCRGVDYLEDLAGVASDRPIAVLHPRGTPTTGGRSRGWWTDADDLVAFADHLGLDAVDVVAHSAGTRLALAALARHPARIRSLALVTPPAAWLTGVAYDGDALARARRDPLVDAAFASITGDGPRDQAEFERARVTEGPAGYARWTERERAHATVGAWRLSSIEAYFTGIPDDAAARILAAPRRPTLVVAGDGDILVGVGPVRAYADALGADLRMLAECGHYPWVEQPAAFRTALEGWRASGSSR